ncbi:MAG: zinc-ribbon domain-containing protein [Clostridiales bacterium]|nr:zinc-ribbon domain-containing protein [Clostridiales bacterium]
MKNCPKCGTEISDNALFCNKCGTKIEQTEESEAASEKAQPQLLSEEAETENTPEAAAPEVPAAEAAHAAPAKKKSSKVPILIGCSAAAIVLAAGSIAVYQTRIVPERKYNEAAAALEEGNYEAAASQFEVMGEYKDAKERAREANALIHYTKAMNAFDAGDYAVAKTEFEAAGNYKDSEKMAEEAEIGTHYAQGVLYLAYGNKEKAAEELVLAKDFKDANELAGKCLIELGDKAAEEEDYEKAATYWSRAEFFTAVPDRDEPFIYGLGIKAMNEKDYNKAIEEFARIPTYKDAHLKECDCYYQLAEKEYAAGNLEDAEKYYEKCEMRAQGSYEKHKEICKTLGLAALEKKDYDKAAMYLEKAAEYSDEAAEKGKEAFYLRAGEYFNSKNYREAAKLYKLAGNYKDSAALAKESNYQYGIESMAEGYFDTAKDFLAECGKYKSAQDLIRVCNAEIYYADGLVNQAVSTYAKVPKTLKINGFDIQGRKAMISAESTLAKAGGSYTAKSNNTYVKNIKKTKRYKKWKKWYLKRTVSDQTLEIEYSKNDDGTFDITFRASFVYFTNYSSNMANVETDYYDVTKTIEKVKTMPSKIKLDSYTTLVYKKGVFTLVYSRNKKSGSSTNQFRSTVKFKKTA